MAQIVPLEPVPSQSVSVTLGGQSCRIDVLQRAYGLYVNVYLAGEPVVLGVQGLNLNRIVRSAYLGFVGDLTFVDTQGTDAPYYTGLGTRWLLEYIEG